MGMWVQNFTEKCSEIMKLHIECECCCNRFDDIAFLCGKIWDGGPILFYDSTSFELLFGDMATNVMNSCDVLEDGNEKLILKPTYKLLAGPGLAGVRYRRWVRQINGPLLLRLVLLPNLIILPYPFFRRIA